MESLGSVTNRNVTRSSNWLWFLSIAAANRKFVDEDYRDSAIGRMGRHCYGKLVMTHVELRPVVRWSSSCNPIFEAQ